MSIKDSNSISFIKILSMFLIVFILILFVLALWYTPKWQIPKDSKIDAKGLLELENEYRKTTAQILGGIFLIFGIYLTWRRILVTEEIAKASNRNAYATEQGQITERFSRAVEMLGSDSDVQLSLRLGGIYSLQRIASDSPKDTISVIEVLCAFVRDRTKNKSQIKRIDKGKKMTEILGPPIDIQTTLNVLGRLNLSNNEFFCKLDLDNSNLVGVNLKYGDFRLANLVYSNLKHANFNYTRFDDADLSGAILDETLLGNTSFNNAFLHRTSLRKLQRVIDQPVSFKNAVLAESDLSYAHLENSDLSYAVLAGAKLDYVKFSGANLENADIRGDLRKVQGLTQNQINSALGDLNTKLPEGLIHPNHWKNQEFKIDWNTGLYDNHQKLSN